VNRLFISDHVCWSRFEGYDSVSLVVQFIEVKGEDRKKCARTYFVNNLITASESEIECVER
jgi:hypothetical protein